ncbi:MAG: carbohydrate-binding domain-containing protein [Bacilli bacterium]|nr:carbohydrate-binding domain-containing protein [Bacilli bacterium]
MKCNRSLLRLAPLVLSGALLASCGNISAKNAPTNDDGGGNTTVNVSDAESITIEEASDDISESFSIQGNDTSTQEDGSSASSNVENSDSNIIRITEYGTYTLSGQLNGQIYIECEENENEDDVVELDLNGLSLSYGQNSPIYMISGNELKIKALKGTDNFIYDTRSAYTADVEGQGKGAIYSKADTKFVGTGSLTIVGNYYNGVHCTKDVKIKNQTLTVKANNHGIKGEDSIKMETGNVNVIAYNGDGLHSENTDLSSSNKQRGNIEIYGGTLKVLSSGDALDAAYDLIVSDGTDDDGNATSPVIYAYTSKYANAQNSDVSASYSTSTYSDTTTYNRPGGGGTGGNTGGPGGGGMGGGGMGGGGMGGGSSSQKADESAKGYKAANTITISGGTSTLYTYDDGLHANYGDTFESGGKGVGDINISGGKLTINASDDGVHADSNLNISGGTVKVESSYEGLEGNLINISGGESVVYASDDAVNAANCGPNKTPAIKVTGGYLTACVPSNGDVDGIDSNGTYTQIGGVVVVCGPSSEMAAAMDCDGTASVSGGTLAVFGYARVSSKSVTTSSKSGSYSGGSAYKLTFANGNVTTGTLLSGYTYSGCTTYSNLGTLSSVSKA